MPLYPVIEPFSHGTLNVGDGQLVHWEVSGNPDGKPAVLLHGGPGAPSPGLVHGRFDIGGPPDVPWLLAQVWPDARLHLVRTGHHGGAEMVDHLVAATGRFAARPGS
jgi:hypothetical protein